MSITWSYACWFIWLPHRVPPHCDMTLELSVSDFWVVVPAKKFDWLRRYTVVLSRTHAGEPPTSFSRRRMQWTFPRLSLISLSLDYWHDGNKRRGGCGHKKRYCIPTRYCLFLVPSQSCLSPLPSVTKGSFVPKIITTRCNWYLGGWNQSIHPPPSWWWWRMNHGSISEGTERSIETTHTFHTSEYRFARSPNTTTR